MCVVCDCVKHMVFTVHCVLWCGLCKLQLGTVRIVQVAGLKYKVNVTTVGLQVL
jgi:hypothetical protein